MLPTMLIKMQPWTAAEISALRAYLAPPELDESDRLTLVEDPLDPARSFLSADFYSGDFPAQLAARVPVHFTPRTDDQPYFGVLRKKLQTLAPDHRTYLDPGTASVLNSSLIKGAIPMDLIHLIVTGLASLVFVLLFVLVPLRFGKIGREVGANAAPLLLYFSCLGAGFIILELVFIQKFMHLIGSPLHTYSTVIFTFLLGAGTGSAASERLGIGCHRGWAIPFVGVIAVGSALVALYPWLSHLALALPLAGRILASSLMILPLGFFLGMPFPLGILALANQPTSAIAWAWGMNGVFTVAGGLLAVVLSAMFGFNITILFALSLYAAALLVFRRMRGAVAQAAGAEEWQSTGSRQVWDAA
jgi:hypothetical protein